MIRLLAALAIAMLMSPTIADRNTRVYPIHLEKPLRQDLTNSTLRDDSGFLWIGTEDGLKRYDGYKVRVFQHEPNNPESIGSSHIHALIEHSDGTLWAAGNTLSRYHPETETFTNYVVSDFRGLYTMFEDAQGDLWLGGERTGLIQFRPSTGKVVQQLFADASNPLSISHITPQQGGDRLWLASNEGLLLFDPATLSATNYFTLPDMSGVRPLYNVVEESNGKVWVTTREGLFVIDPQSGSQKQFPVVPEASDQLGTHAVAALAKDSHEQIWIGTDKHGVYRYDAGNDRFVHFPASANDSYRFPPARITHIHEDEEGTLWFSASFNGVYRISAHLQKFRSFQHSFDSNNSLAFNNVLAIHEDSRGYIWIATDGVGLDRFDPATRKFKHFRHDPKNPATLSTDSIIDIAEDSRGNLWLGTWAGGLNKLDPDSGTVTRIQRDPTAPRNRTLVENNVLRIVIDQQDRLVMAVGSSGLQIYDPRSGTYRTFTPGGAGSGGIKSDFVNAIQPTTDGRYWIAGYKGLELFSPTEGSFESYPLPVNDPILDLHLSDDGLLWIASKRGLLRFNPATVEAAHFSVKEGLSDNHIVGIEQDNMGNLWLATRNGLNRFDPISKQVETFGADDGLAGVQFNRLSHVKTRDGLMYFGSTQGFSIFDPLQIPRNEYAPKIHFTGLTVNHQTQNPKSSPWLEEVINATDHLILPNSADDVRITFSATNLISPTQNEYRYRLLGLSDQWFDVASDLRTVQYNNLAAGDYRLQVIASNNDGVWTGSTKGLNITILPSWWQTWWAYFLYACMFIASMYGFSLWRLRVTLRRRRQLELQVSEQTMKLKEANRAISHLNSELEQRVQQRTRDLSAEIEERKESEAKATYIAYHDTLSGLYNRAWLLQRLADLLQTHQKSEPTDHHFALLFIGGDRFRTINDTYGHQMGDKVLIAAAEKLRQLCTDSIDAVRLGSDEFIVIMNHVESSEQASSMAETILARFREPIVIGEARLLFSVSVGFVISDDHYNEPAHVLRNANIAMQRAKDRGRGLCQEFDDEMLQQTLDQVTLETDLKLALARNQFSVVYQPIVELDSIAIADFEVLIRWQHPQRGMIPPDRFIAMAEASGLIFDIGLWVLEQACLQLKQWQKNAQTQRLPIIAVNLSPVQLERPDFLTRIDEIFARTNIHPNQIEFEITESALLRHTDTVTDILEALRERGIKLAIDDFGTGYSSLSYLDKLPVQVLKIDRSFVNALTEDHKHRNSTSEIVRATISLAHNLGMAVVAEGIETQQQLNMLQSYGCDFGQGYFISRPLTPEDATAFLIERK